MARVLIVANQTAGGRHLYEEVRRRAEAGQRSFTLLVPSTRPHSTLTWTDGQARLHAKERMEAAIARLSDLDIEIEGIVGVAPTPFDTVIDAVREGSYDEIVISTLPHTVSHWLRMDLPSRVARHTGLPVTHIVASEKHAVA